MRRQALILLLGLLSILPAFSQNLSEKAELVSALNSPYDEYQPCITPNGKVLYFSRKGHPLNIGGDDHYDVWVAYKKSNGSWGKAVNIGTSINDKSDNIVVGTSTNGDLLYLLDERYGLVFTQKTGRTWSIPQPVEIEGLEQPLSSANYYLSGNTQVLLIAMPGSDGYGGRDIYISNKIKTGLWSEPKNLGATINSSKEEYFAALAVDGKTLYFISNGHGNPMQTSIWMSRCTNDELTAWETPQNIGIDLNPQQVSQFFSFPSEGDAFFCSTSEMAASGEIAEVSIPKKYQPNPTVLLTGRLIDAETGKSLKGSVQLQAFTASANHSQYLSERDGSYQLILPRDKDFGIFAESQGYFAVSETMALAGNTSLKELDEQNMTADAAPGSTMLSTDAEQLQLRLNKVSTEFQQLAEARRKDAIFQARQVRRTKGLARQTDPELESLKYKYKAITRVEEEEVEEPKELDSELEAMKRKFRQHNDVQEDKKVKRKSNETELEAMKRKFNQENQQTQERKDEEELMDMTLSPETKAAPKSFDDLVTDVWYDLEGQLVPEVSYELKTDLIPEVADEIKSEMDDYTRKGYVNKFERLATNLKSESKKELRRKYRAEVKRELKGELIEIVEEELRVALKDEVKQELRVALEEEVRNELRLELEYQIKKEIMADLQKELKAEIKALKKEDRTPQTPRHQPKKNLRTKGRKTYKEREQLDIKLYKLAPGKTIPLNHVFFQANKAEIKKESSTDLNRVLDFLQKNPQAIVEIGAHTNGWCSVEFSEKLSTGRAQAVADYLIANGAEADQILHHGYGRSRPLVPNDSLENCKKNQRIELKIIKI